jgi:hypothetical protein
MVDGQPTNKPVDKNNHLMDANRYSIQAIFEDVVSIRPQIRVASKMGFTNFGV